MNVSPNLFRKLKLLSKASLSNQSTSPKEAKSMNHYLVTHLVIVGIKTNKNGQNQEELKKVTTMVK
jgi:hypothetical protein